MAVFVNDSAGGGHGQEIAAEIENHFRAVNVQVEVMLTTPKNLERHVQRSIAGGVHSIVVGGGDGSLRTVAALLVDSEITLGVLPLGTLNHFAKDLNIPLDLAAAVQMIAAGHSERVDVGDINGRIFINNSSLGIYPSVVRFRERQRTHFGIGKWPAMVWAILRVLYRNSTLNVRLDTGEGACECRTPFAFVGNNEYVLEGFDIGARRSLRDGVLSLYTARPMGRWGVLKLAVRALFGHLHGSTDFHEMTAKEIVIKTSRRRMSVATDGEISTMSTPLRYRVRPLALRVFVPAQTDTVRESG